MAHDVTLIPGDWVGPETCEVVKSILAAAGVGIVWDEHMLGRGGPEEALLASCRRTGVVLKARSEAIRQPGQLPATLQLRRALGLWAIVRPVQALPNTGARFPATDLIVVREISEGIYSGLEHEVAQGVFEAVKVTTAAACERIARFAYELALEKGRKTVTIAHKSNIMKKSDGMFLRIATEVGQAYADQGIETESAIVDALCMRLVRNPNQFDLLLTPNLFGDIVSDLCAGLAGGITASPSAAYGDGGIAMFENPHGRAAELVGTGKANPIPMLRAALLMLAHLGEHTAAERISDALIEVCEAGGAQGCQDVREKMVERVSS